MIGESQAGEKTQLSSFGMSNSMLKVFDALVKHTGGVESVCFSPDGKRFASGSYDCTVIVLRDEDDKGRLM
jgi:WD40 repeat protein